MTSIKTKRYLLWFWSIVFLGMLGVFLLFLGVSWGLLGKLPDFEELENPKSLLASEIYTADQQLIGRYFKENRSHCRYDEISPHVINALIATEDERYLDHSGIDLKGVARALAYLGAKGGASTITQQLAKMLFHKRRGGTIGRIVQKLKEWVIASKLERQYTKEEIVTMYLNKFDFINNAVGIKSGAQVYFNKAPDSLKIEEAALLVGMCKNPSLFNPLRRKDTSIYRRNVVLAQMLRNQLLTRAEFDSLKQLPLTLNFKRVDHKEGIAPYFREILRAELAALLNKRDDDGKLLIEKAEDIPYNLYGDGLKIYTTLDSRMQQHAEWAVAEHLGKELQRDFWRDLKGHRKDRYPFDWRMSKKKVEELLDIAKKRTPLYRILSGQECEVCGRRGKYILHDEESRAFICQAEDCGNTRHAPPTDSIDIIFNTPKKMKVFSWKGAVDTVFSPMDSIKYYKTFLHAGFMAMDPHTGFIKAWVGGIDFKTFAYDHVKQGRRQVGSTFKPFVYALAMQSGLSPCTEIANIEYTIEKGKWGLQKDWTPKNTGYNFDGMLSLKFGLANSMNNVTAWIMKQYGPHAVIDFARKMGITSPLNPVPSLCLGVADLTLYELVGANAAFANKGVWQEPVFISRVENNEGNVIYDYRRFQQSRDAMSEETAYAMLDLMKGVIDGVYNKNIQKGSKKPGTAMRLRGSTETRPYAGHSYPIAGKTGTTQNHSDGWFMGITPDLVAGAWVGAEDRGVRFSRLNLGMGTNMALPIWGYFMQKVHTDPTLTVSKEDFERPQPPYNIELDCDKIQKEDRDIEEIYDEFMH